jgi:hypothetical protein
MALEARAERGEWWMREGKLADGGGNEFGLCGAAREHAAPMELGIVWGGVNYKYFAPSGAEGF